MSTPFRKFVDLPREAQEASIVRRETLHVEPVIVHDESDLSRSMAVLHLQLGVAHAILDADEVEQLIIELAQARGKLQ